MWPVERNGGNKGGSCGSKPLEDGSDEGEVIGGSLAVAAIELFPNHPISQTIQFFHKPLIMKTNTFESLFLFLIKIHLNTHLKFPSSHFVVNYPINLNRSLPSTIFTFLSSCYILDIIWYCCFLFFFLFLNFFSNNYQRERKLLWFHFISSLLLCSFLLSSLTTYKNTNFRLFFLWKKEIT